MGEPDKVAKRQPNRRVPDAGQLGLGWQERASADRFAHARAQIADASGLPEVRAGDVAKRVFGGYERSDDVVVERAFSRMGGEVAGALPLEPGGRADVDASARQPTTVFSLDPKG